MTITLQEINERRDHLKKEILERECLLATLEVLRKHVAANGGSQTVDLGALFPAWRSDRETTSPARPVNLLASAPEALPSPPEPVPTIHPELEKLGTYHGCNTPRVKWAIDQLSGDYTLQDIHAVLDRAGGHMQAAEISVVLSRLKARREITEIQCGYGRRASIYRKDPAGSTDPAPVGA